LTFAKLVERYVAEYVTINCKPRSAAEITRLLRRASRFFGDKPVHEITKGDVLGLIHLPPVEIKQTTASVGGGRRRPIS